MYTSIKRLYLNHICTKTKPFCLTIFAFENANDKKYESLSIQKKEDGEFPYSM